MPSHAESVQQVMSSGIEALAIAYTPVHQFSSPHITVRTALNIHSLDLGLLTADQYKYVAQRTARADLLVQRHLHKLLGLIPGFLAKPGPIRCFTVPAYGRMLRDRKLSTVLFEELSANPQVPANRIAVELSSDLLFEDLDPLIPELERIRELGVGIILTEVGDPFCPLLRLFSLPFDLAVLDPYPVSVLNTEKDAVMGGICELLHAGGKKAIAPGISDPDLLFQLERLGCDGYTLQGDSRSSPVEEEAQ